MSKKAEMIGLKFGRLTPLEVVLTKQIHLFYRCKCECGNIIDVSGNSLRNGNTKSCGCIRRPNLIGLENEHGIVISKVRNQHWKIKCKHCKGEHTQNQREIRNNSHSLKCPNYKPPNYSGLEKWDGIIRRTYGITLDEYHAIIENQGGGCAICGRKQDVVEGRRLSIDHCHTTKKVRGVLCASCNQAIGMLKNNPLLFIKASEYLTNHVTPDKGATP